MGKVLSCGEFRQESFNSLCCLNPSTPIHRIKSLVDPLVLNCIPHIPVSIVEIIWSYYNPRGTRILWFAKCKTTKLEAFDLISGRSILSFKLPREVIMEALLSAYNDVVKPKNKKGR